MSCKENNILKYHINDQYVGPCVIFSYNKNNDEDTIIINNGLGKISTNQIKDKFVFQSALTKKNIDIIPIGHEKEAEEDIRYIFRLSKGSIQTTCVDKHLKTISFYVGTTKEYNNWINQYVSEIDYFESNSIDWCTFYKELND